MSRKESGHTTIDTSIWKPNLKPLPGSVKKVLSVKDSSAATEGVAAAEANGKHSLNISTSAYNQDSKMPLTPRKQSKSAGALSGNKSSSFNQYVEDTSDAWDVGDDDLLFRLKLDPGFVQSTASQVINSHSVSSPPPKAQTKTSQPKKDSKQRDSGEPMPARPKHHSNGVNKVSKPVTEAQSQRELAKLKKFELLLNAPPKNLLDELRPQSWSGIPSSCRPITWKILSGYLPAALDRRELTLERKRQEYFGFLEQYFGTRHEAGYQDIFRQIHIDVPRMNPLIPLFQTKLVQEIFERILYIWAIRHPASGYVQGINDLVTPFFVVFLRESLDADVESDVIDITVLTKQQLDMIEADSYWCMSKLLDGIQDNYTFAQPGIQTKVSALKELTLRIDAELHNHIENQGIEFLQFTFRWMNNLLMRELPLRCTIRLWDTYLAEPEGFADYHLYVCAAFLTKFSKQLKQEHDFQGLMTLLQNLPTQNWSDEDIGELTAEAYRLKYMFADAPQHFKSKT